MKRWSLVIFALVLAVCVGVGVALAAGGKAPARHHAKPPAKAHVAGKTRGNTAENTAPDPDNVQQGDQNGPDGNAQSGESESTPGDASVDGIEQPAGADHQCPPDCSPGEQ